MGVSILFLTQAICFTQFQQLRRIAKMSIDPLEKHFFEMKFISCLKDGLKIGESNSEYFDLKICFTFKINLEFR